MKKTKTTAKARNDNGVTVIGGPRSLDAVALDRLAEAKKEILAGSVPAGSTAWVLLYEVADAASHRMAERAATLHALAHVHALGPACGEEPALPSDILARVEYEGMTAGVRDEMRIVDAALSLADGDEALGLAILFGELGSELPHADGAS